MMRESLIAKIKKKTLIIFDLDNTLVLLNVKWQEIRNGLKEMFRSEFGYECPVYRFYEIFEYIENKYGKEKTKRYFDYLKQKEYHDVQKYGFRLKWFLKEGGLSLIKDLTSDTIQFAIDSNNYHQTIEYVLSKLNIKQEFLSIVGRDDVKRAKPDPEGILKILSELNKTPQETAFIGDNYTDEDAAKAAEVTFIHIEDLKNELEILMKKKKEQ